MRLFSINLLWKKKLLKQYCYVQTTVSDSLSSRSGTHLSIELYGLLFTLLHLSWYGSIVCFSTCSFWEKSNIKTVLNFGRGRGLFLTRWLLGSLQLLRDIMSRLKNLIGNRESKPLRL